MSKQFPKHQDYNDLLLKVNKEVNVNNSEYQRECQLHDQVTKRIQQLVSTGDLVKLHSGTDIQCSNGHKYAYERFHYETSYTYTDVDYYNQTTEREVREWNPTWNQYEIKTRSDETRVPISVTRTHTTQHFGCPVCKSTIVHLASNKDYKLCKPIYFQPKSSLLKVTDEVEDFTGVGVMIVTLGIVPGIFKPFSYIVPKTVEISPPKPTINEHYFFR
jgi:hypothetical protein